MRSKKERTMQSLLQEQQKDTCSCSLFVALLTFRQCNVISRRYWRRVDVLLNFAKKATLSNAKSVESTNVRAKMRALLRIINARMTKNNISRIQKSLLIDIHVNLNRFCDIQQNILNVKRVETRLKSLIFSKNDDEKSKSKLKTTFSSRSNSLRSSSSRSVWSLFVALMRKRIRWEWHHRSITQRSRRKWRISMRLLKLWSK